MNEEAQTPEIAQSPTTHVTPASDMSNPLYGVHGWLKFLVVMNLYVGPILFGLRQIMSWIGYMILLDKHPGIILSGLIDTAVGLYLVVRGIQVARGLRDIQPRAVQNAKALLKLILAWTFVSIPVSFLSGLNAKDLIPGTVKGVLVGVIGFAIWYSYFNVSKRVQATYPDWKE